LQDGTDPEHEALLADSVGLASVVVLETLSRPSAGVRPARHVRRPIRRDRGDAWALTARLTVLGRRATVTRDTQPGTGAVREHRERGT
jgi:hypothetical protein